MAGAVIGGVVLTLVVVAIVGLRSNADGGDRLGRRRVPELGLPTQPPGWDTISDPPEVEPFALGPAPLWGSAIGSPTPGPVEVVRGAAIRDEVAVVWGGDNDVQVDRLSVIDLATGTERWGLGVLQDLPGRDAALFDPYELTVDIGGSTYQPAIIDADDGSWSVITAYLGGYTSAVGGFVDCELVPGPCTSNDPTGEQGVAALAGSDGRVLWTAPVVPGVPAGTMPTESVRAVVAGGDTVLVVLGPSGTPRLGEGGLDGTRVVALDAATGRQRWEAAGVWPVGVSGDTVVGMEGGRPSEITPGDRAADTTVVALDARTGERRWDRLAKLPWRMSQPIAGDLVVVEVPAAGTSSRTDTQTEVLVLESASGDEVASFGIFASGCRSDGASLIACGVMFRGERDKLATFRVDDREAGVAEHDLPDLYVDAVWRDSVVVTSWDLGTEDSPDGPRRLVDLAGRPVAEDLPGTVLASSDRYVILACGGLVGACPDETTPDELLSRYAVHEITTSGGG